MQTIFKVFTYLPPRQREEIWRLAESRGAFESISEIRMRAMARSSFLISGERIYLSTSVTKEDITKCVSLMCEGALYARRDGISEGYVTLEGGVRVGICGQARYDGGRLVGISNITSLVFRIPTGSFFNIRELFDAWKSTERGMLIYSPPGVGKTTALRSLAAQIGSGRGSEVAVIDERCEFLHEDYKLSSVDILRGYRRSEGIQIALRTLSPDVIAVDEIGRLSEAEAMLESLNSGVKIIATAHAGTLEELKRRANMQPFFKNGIFDVLVGIYLENGRRTLHTDRF